MIIRIDNATYLSLLFTKEFDLFCWIRNYNVFRIHGYGIIIQHNYIFSSFVLFFFLFCFVFCCSCFLFCLFSFFVSVFVSYSVVSLVKSKIYTMKHFFLLLSTVVLPLKILSQNFHIFLNVRKWYFLFSLYTKLSLITVVFCFEDFTYFIHSFIICKLYRCKLYRKFLSEI